MNHELLVLQAAAGQYNVSFSYLCSHVCLWGTSAPVRVRHHTRHFARSRGRTEQNANEADREVHVFGCNLTTFKCQELRAQGKQTRRCMHERDRQDGEKE